MPATATAVRRFSAVGYLFSRILQEKLNVPVGIIQSTWGGSPIQAWMDVKVLDSFKNDGAFIDKSVTKAAHQTPGNLFNGMIAPLIGFRIAGVLWYQGEQNRYNPALYKKLLPAMVKSWREDWHLGEWPFYYVQIAPMDYPKEQKALVPLMREAQMQAAGSIPNSGMVVTLDAGDEKSIHPPDKALVAKRLAFWALAKVYEKKGIAFEGPVYKSMKISKESIELYFDNAPNGLTSFGKKFSLFEIAGEDKVFYPAKTAYKEGGLSVHSDLVKEPRAVRYAFKDWVTGDLFNTEGIPASSFRTDEW